MKSSQHFCYDGRCRVHLYILRSPSVRRNLSLKDVLDRLLAGSTDYASLRPDHWAALHPEHIRTYRADER
ncbi:MAG: hypothetical protein ACYC35_29865, partial [Pirellulales bacterium]